MKWRSATISVVNIELPKRACTISIMEGEGGSALCPVINWRAWTGG